jgi:glutamate-1-semialdehyde 2,1-aminomutase
VNSPVRAFKAVGGAPVFVQRGIGPYVYDVDGNRYVDFVGSWGPLVLGHADPDVIAAIVHTAASGTTFRGAHAARDRARRARAVHGAVDGEDAPGVVGAPRRRCRRCAPRAGFTGRRRIIKVEGGYHGHADLFAGQGGSGRRSRWGSPRARAACRRPRSPTRSVVPFNDLDAMRRRVRGEPRRDRGPTVEAIPANMGVVLPRPADLPLLRSLCDNTARC